MIDARAREGARSPPQFVSPSTTFQERSSASSDAELWVAGRHRIVGLGCLARDEAEQWRTKLTALATDCGCGMGALLGMAALGVYLAAIAIGLGPPRGSIFVGVVVFVAGAGLGKFLGIWRARRALDRSVDELKHRIILSGYGV